MLLSERQQDGKAGTTYKWAILVEPLHKEPGPDPTQPIATMYRIKARSSQAGARISWAYTETAVSADALPLIAASVRVVVGNVKDLGRLEDIVRSELVGPNSPVGTDKRWVEKVWARIVTDGAVMSTHSVPGFRHIENRAVMFAAEMERTYPGLGHKGSGNQRFPVLDLLTGLRDE